MDINERIVPLEDIIKLRYLEQYAKDVVNYSSRYNYSSSFSYAPINLIDKYHVYPAYGDFPEGYFLRTYGKWWKKSKSVQKEYRPQDFDLLAAEDFVTLRFGTAVLPRDICIYEIYNPGAVIRIWGALIRNDTITNKKWHLLWEGFPRKCDPSAKKFCPRIRKTNALINVLRIEFNQYHLEYHTSIDAILLGGFEPESRYSLHYEIISSGLATTAKREISNLRNVNSEEVDSASVNYFSLLPDEIILHIFEYLDLRSLSRCAQVNKRWNELSQDQSLYQNISLKIYWYLVNADVLEYFLKKCTSVKKLDLSWCNNGKLYFNRNSSRDSQKYHQTIQCMLRAVHQTLTHLALNDNYYVDIDILCRIAECKELTELRLHHTYNWIQAPLNTLTKLVTLDLSLTNILDGDLLQILVANPNLEHLILDLCENLQSLDDIVEAVIRFNKKLKTWSSWKATSLTSEGIKKFSYCQNLEELDLGWCLVNVDPGDCLEYIANGCKRITRLILSGWRGISDQLLMPVILSCKELYQLDLLGIKTIGAEVCEKALFLLPKLRLLDISFCDSIREDEVDIWKQQYPHITIQRSCQFSP